MKAFVFIIMNTPENYPHPEAESRLVTTQEVAAFIGASPRHVHNLVQRRLIPVVKVGKLSRFDLQQVKAALAKLTIHERA